MAAIFFVLPEVKLSGFLDELVVRLYGRTGKHILVDFKEEGESADVMPVKKEAVPAIS